jgi:hypothetical protein
MWTERQWGFRKTGTQNHSGKFSVNQNVKERGAKGAIMNYEL